MIKLRSLFVLLLLGLILAAPLVLNADPVKKASDLAVFQPIEIPGMVLLPGNYVIKVPDPVDHANMVGFYNEDESYLYKLVRTIPTYRLDATDKTVITFEERAHGAPDAVKTWFFPGDHWGKEFVYSKAKAIEVAEAEPTLLTAPAPEPALAPTPEVAEVVAAPEFTREPVAEALVASPVEVVEAAPAEAQEIAAAPIEELPKTGSSLPLIALLGVGSLVVGGLLRWLPNRTMN